MDGFDKLTTCIRIPKYQDVGYWQTRERISGCGPLGDGLRHCDARYVRRLTLIETSCATDKRITKLTACSTIVENPLQIGPILCKTKPIFEKVK